VAQADLGGNLKPALMAKLLVFSDFSFALAFWKVLFITSAVLTVYFGTPSMFITLWFGFDYGTNPPLGTLII
jgi:hypothetical protein